MRPKPGKDDGYAPSDGPTGGEAALRTREQYGKGSVRLVVRYVRTVEIDVTGGRGSRDRRPEEPAAPLLEPHDPRTAKALVEGVEQHTPGYLAEILRATVRPWTSSTGSA
jgi:hypothetical protein